MKRFSVVLVTLAVVFASQNVFSEPQAELKPIGKGFQTEQRIKTQPEIGTKTDGNGLVAQSDNWKPFLPKDTVHLDDHVGIPCNKNGQYDNSQQRGATYRCLSVQSRETATHYRIRSSGAEGDRIFIVKNGKPKLYVQFTGGSDKYRVVYASPNALQFAENNGYILDKRNNTMVAKSDLPKDNPQVEQPTDNPATPQTANVADCASKTALLEKMKCITDNAAAQNK